MKVAVVGKRWPREWVWKQVRMLAVTMGSTRWRLVKYVFWGGVVVSVLWDVAEVARLR